MGKYIWQIQYVKHFIEQSSLLHKKPPSSGASVTAAMLRDTVKEPLGISC